jgi:hypothetical protein
MIWGHKIEMISNTVIMGKSIETYLVFFQQMNFCFFVFFFVSYFYIDII